LEQTEEELQQYAEAIKSAETKFDHKNEYFKKGAKGLE